MKIEKEQISIFDFASSHKGLTNSALFEKIYTDKEVATKLKKSNIVYVYELVEDEKPLFTFVFNKGFMRGKVFCILPERYLEAVEAELQQQKADAFGGPDRAHDSFTDVQKAINYAMTSFFTTGGIRGGKKKLDKFYPRSFNMGVRKDVYQALGGFSKMRFGEDIDFSIRIFKGGYACRLFPEAWVWHKRRTDLKKFFKQVHNSGIARINLYKKYPESLKLVHTLPALFTLGVAFLLLASFFWGGSLSLLFLFALIVFVDASMQNKSLKIGILAIAASFIQLTGYGTGFLRAWWKRCVCGKSEFAAFEKNFYK